VVCHAIGVAARDRGSARAGSEGCSRRAAGTVKPAAR